MLNKTMLIGRLGKDPELRYLENGTPVITFSLATECSWRDEARQKQTETEWQQRGLLEQAGRGGQPLYGKRSACFRGREAPYAFLGRQ
jgi:Single-strand binding protein family